MGQAWAGLAVGWGRAGAGLELGWAGLWRAGAGLGWGVRSVGFCCLY